MRIKSISLLLFVIVTCHSFAGIQSDTLSTFKKHSMQFKASLTNLSTFKGSLLSYKYHLNTKNALRFSISLYSSQWHQDNLQENISDDPSLLDQDLIYNDTRGSVSIQYFKYFNPDDEIIFYLGAGPQISLLLDNYESDNVKTHGMNYDYEIDRNNDYFAFGISICYGMEWFFRKNMSLHAEYGFDLQYFYKNNNGARMYPNYTTTIEFSQDKKGYKFDDSGALIGLSVYF